MSIIPVNNPDKHLSYLQRQSVGLPMSVPQSKDIRENPYRPPKTDVVPAGASASPNAPALPPAFVKVFSFFFAWFIITPFLPFTVGHDSASFLAFRFAANRDPMLWVNIIGGLYFLAAISGLAILFRVKAAYDVASIYCICAVAAAVALHFIVPMRSINWANAAFQYPLLAWFAYHTFTNRHRWRQQYSDRSR